jgi:hypothetical protein
MQNDVNVPEGEAQAMVHVRGFKATESWFIIYLVCCRLSAAASVVVRCHFSFLTINNNSSSNGGQNTLHTDPNLVPNM